MCGILAGSIGQSQQGSLCDLFSAALQATTNGDLNVHVLGKCRVFILRLTKVKQETQTPVALIVLTSDLPLLSKHAYTRRPSDAIAGMFPSPTL